MTASAPSFDEGVLGKYEGQINPKPQSVIKLATVNKFDDECWSLVRHVVLVQNVWGLNKRQKELFDVLVSRAELFYTQYQVVRGDASAALLAYYFALNLIKAYLCVNNPALVQGKITHGLGFDPTMPTKVKTLTSTNEIFPAFYHFFSGDRLKKTHIFDTKVLVANVREFGVQTDILKIKRGYVGFSYVLPTAESLDSCWIVGKMHNDEVKLLLNSQATFLKKFNKHFSKVTMTNEMRSKLFLESAFDGANHLYFQSKKVFSFRSLHILEETEKYIKEAFSNKLLVNIFDEKTDYDIHLPIKNKGKVLLSELVACYLLTYWASSVIRYDPTIKVLGSKYSPLRNVFDESVRSTPYLLLRHMCSLLAKHDIQFELRH